MRLSSLLIGTLALLGSAVQADTVTARVIADDFFAVFVGNASGSSMTRVGGSAGALWYSQGSPFSFNASAGEYIYVAAWDSASYGPPHMWIGEFAVGGNTLYSNTTDWAAKFDNTVKDPSDGQVSSLAQTVAAWLPPLVGMPNGSAPYGSLIGGAPASMIWHDAFDGTSASESGYALFRALAPVTRAPPVGTVPEPSSYALLIAGLGLMGFASRRRA